MARQLPPNANIRHLKSQAKALVRDLRAGIPAAAQRIREALSELADLTDRQILDRSFSLKNAQRAIARQYGFGSWIELAHHVAGNRRFADDSSLNPQFTFDTFIAGEINAFAVEAARRVAENPGEVSPLLLYGPYGSGKTHLLQAVGSEILRRDADASVVYVHSQRFVQDLVQALQTSTMLDFIQHYHSINVLLIDDLQFLANKIRSQEEFFQVLNTLYECRRQMVFTCDRCSSDVAGLEARLKSRFIQGQVVELKRVDFAGVDR